MIEDNVISPEQGENQAPLTRAERKRAYGIKWRAANIEKKRAYDAARLENPEIRERKRQYAANRRANPEAKEKERQYFEALKETPEGREKLRMYQAKRVATPEGRARKNSHCAKFRQRPGTKEKQRAYMVEWLKTPEGRASYKAAAVKRRAAKKGADIADAKAIKAWIKGWRALAVVECNWCHARVKPGDVHIDHIMPLARGGKHTITNLCCSCAKCNREKGAMLPGDWIAVIARKNHID